jgi:hypothetical protein
MLFDPRKLLFGALIVGLCFGARSAHPQTASTALSHEASSSSVAKTPLGYGTYQDIVAGVNQPDNQVWWAVHEPSGSEHLYLSFNTTPSLGLPVPILLYMGINPQGRWFSGFLPIVPGYRINQTPAEINSPLASVNWNPAAKQYQINVTVPNVLTANLRISGRVGGATLPANWDGQISYWTQSIGTGTANGKIAFPQISSDGTVASGAYYATDVTDWGVEQESQFGNFQLGSGPNGVAGAIHVGYDYASTYNQDGSTDTLYTFPLLKGGWHGIMTTTFADGRVSQCADPAPAESKWYTDAGGLSYPTEISVSCNSRHVVFTTSAEGTVVNYSTVETNGFAAANSNTTSNQGGVGLIQHIRDVGYFGATR